MTDKELKSNLPPFSGAFTLSKRKLQIVNRNVQTFPIITSNINETMMICEPDN